MAWPAPRRGFFLSTAASSGIGTAEWDLLPRPTGSHSHAFLGCEDTAATCLLRMSGSALPLCGGFLAAMELVVLLAVAVTAIAMASRLLVASEHQTLPALRVLALTQRAITVCARCRGKHDERLSLPRHGAQQTFERRSLSSSERARVAIATAPEHE